MEFVVVITVMYETSTKVYNKQQQNYAHTQKKKKNVLLETTKTIKLKSNKILKIQSRRSNKLFNLCNSKLKKITI